MTSGNRSQGHYLLQQTHIFDTDRSSECSEEDNAGTSNPPEALHIQDIPQDVLRNMVNTSFFYVQCKLVGRVIPQGIEDRSPTRAKSSLSNRSKNAILGSEHAQKLRAVGWGCCGKVYHELGTTHVIKKVIDGNVVLAENCRLWNELLMHKRVEEAVGASIQRAITPRVNVPRLHRYISEGDVWWAAHKD